MLCCVSMLPMSCFVFKQIGQSFAKQTHFDAFVLLAHMQNNCFSNRIFAFPCGFGQQILTNPLLMFLPEITTLDKVYWCFSTSVTIKLQRDNI